jgi:hypothetical protein
VLDQGLTEHGQVQAIPAREWPSGPILAPDNPSRPPPQVRLY